MAEGSFRHYTEWTPRPIKISRFKYEDESRETSIIMNFLGYGPAIRQKRREAYTENDRLMNARGNTEVVQITAGSKAEGLTCIFESDRDSIFVLPKTVCLEDGLDESTILSHINVLKMNMQSSNAGYCRPLLVRLAPSVPRAIIHSLCDDGYWCNILSSSYFVEHFKSLRPRFPPTMIYARAGPSLPWSLGPIRNDSVVAIGCYCPLILQKCASRARHWPPPDIVAKIIAMRAFITPIGFKGSKYNHLEWRICFNTAETELVNNLNDTQVKIYVILKMVVSDVLKPRSKEITSYLLKNIVFWLAENNPQTMFNSESVFHWLHEGLDMLRTAISISQLPYYMIPDRNLMAERVLEVEQQFVLVRSITDMMEEGPRVLLRLNRIRKAIICHPEPLLWYNKMRAELEMLHLEYNNRLLQLIDENFEVDETDHIVQACNKRKNQIQRKILYHMHLEGSAANINVSVNDLTNLFEMMLS